MKFKDIQELVAYAQTHPDKVFFTSDTHFGHAKIISLCNRPFTDVTDMNDTIVDNWNKVVSEDSVVFHLGDFCFGGPTAWSYIRERLNGSICLIRGNHDDHNLKRSTMALFDGVTYQLRLQMNDGNTVYLNHYPFLCFGGSYRDAQNVWQLYGHVHSYEGSTGLDSSRLVHCFPTQYDVGVDNNDFTPISYNQVKQIITNNVKKIK